MPAPHGRAVWPQEWQWRGTQEMTVFPELISDPVPWCSPAMQPNDLAERFGCCLF
jgi:hypothetical protein